MNLSRIAACCAAHLILVRGLANAQLNAAKEGAIVYGHHHLNVTDVAAHRRFWAGTLGGEAVAFGESEIIRFENVPVFIRERAPGGGTKGTTVNPSGSSASPDLSQHAIRAKQVLRRAASTPSREALT